MQMKKIKEIAANKGVAPGKMSRTDLIRAIQRAEGNADCCRGYSKLPQEG